MNGKAVTSPRPSSSSSSFPTTNNGVSFERYVPKRELPEEIKQLPVDETRCKFCGVSYLVHHEVKRLDNLVHQLEDKLKKGEQDREALLELVETQKEKTQAIKNEKENLQFKLQSQLLPSLSLLQYTVTSWRHTISDIRNQLQVTMLRNIPAALQHLQSTCQTSLLALKSENDREKDKLQSMVDKLKEVLSNEEKEREKERDILRETVKQREKTINQLKKETTESREQCLIMEHQLSTNIKLLQKSQTELDIYKSEGIKINEQNKILEEELKKERVKNTQQSMQLEDIKNKLELLTKDNISDRDRFGKDKDHLHAQLVLKDKEMNRLTLELEREKQTKERLKIEHKELLVKTRALMEREKNSELESMKLQLTRDYNDYRTKTQVKIEQLEKRLLDVTNDHRKEIKELESSSHKIKLTFEAEVTRHLSEEKTLQLQVEKCHKLLTDKEKKNQQNEKRIVEIEAISLQSTAKYQEELERKELEYNQSLQRQTLELNKKLLDMEEKLKAAYSEVSVLQSIVERQVNERRQLLEQYNH